MQLYRMIAISGNKTKKLRNIKDQEEEEDMAGEGKVVPVVTRELSAVIPKLGE